jgi:hypothetical protein
LVSQVGPDRVEAFGAYGFGRIALGPVQRGTSVTHSLFVRYRSTECFKPLGQARYVDCRMNSSQDMHVGLNDADFKDVRTLLSSYGTKKPAQERRHATVNRGCPVPRRPDDVKVDSMIHRLNYDRAPEA